MARVLGSAFAVTLAALALAAPATAQLSSAEIVERLNGQRAASGIPAGIVERPEWSSGCAKHVTYMRETGVVDHSEDHSSPFYSPDGEWAAENSVLSGSGSWAEGNPWETAPIHLSQLLAPPLAEIGAAEDGEYGCATTFAGYSRPAPAAAVVHTYPGNGVSGVATEMFASELPFTPGDLVGLGNRLTGPYIYAFLHGPISFKKAGKITLERFSLTGPSGGVPIRLVDSTFDTFGGLVPAPMGFAIPADPLPPGTYTSFARFSEGTAAESSFTTAGAAPAAAPAASKPPKPPLLKKVGLRAGGIRLTYSAVPGGAIDVFATSNTDELRQAGGQVKPSGRARVLIRLGKGPWDLRSTLTTQTGSTVGACWRVTPIRGGAIYVDRC